MRKEDSKNTRVNWFGYSVPKVYTTLSEKEKKLPFLKRSQLVILRFIIHPIKRRIAKRYLMFLKKKFGLKVIGITGSAGKTTTKEMLASILSLENKCVYSTKNIDPVYNIPTTILKCYPWTKYLILEMGIEYPGEMDYYLWLAKPDMVIVTNISATHTLFLGDIKGVYAEKIKIIKDLSPTSTVVLNGNAPMLIAASKLVKSKVILFGEGHEVSAQRIKMGLGSGTTFLLKLGFKSIEIKLPTLGYQFVENALAASSMAKALNIAPQKIKIGLQSFLPPEHRMKVLTGKKGVVVIDDTYNNNPQAAQKALETLVLLGEGKKKVLVFADMLELGEIAEKSHRDFGQLVGKNKLDFVVGTGPMAKLTVEEAAQEMGFRNAVWEPTKDKIPSLLENWFGPECIILVKGSRFMALDKIIPELL